MPSTTIKIAFTLNEGDEKVTELTQYSIKGSVTEKKESPRNIVLKRVLAKDPYADPNVHLH